MVRLRRISDGIVIYMICDMIYDMIDDVCMCAVYAFGGLRE